MNKVGEVISLFISNNQSSFPAKKKEIKTDLKGIVGDSHYNKNIERSILITSISSYHLAKKHHIAIPHGILGENLLIDFNPYHLASGTQLKIGTSILEISQNCTLCKHLSNVDKHLPKLLKNDRGIFAKVVQEGNIKVGDDIFLISSTL